MTTHINNKLICQESDSYKYKHTKNQDHNYEDLKFYVENVFVSLAIKHFMLNTFLYFCKTFYLQQ